MVDGSMVLEISLGARFPLAEYPSPCGTNQGKSVSTGSRSQYSWPHAIQLTSFCTYKKTRVLRVGRAQNYVYRSVATELR